MNCTYYIRAPLLLIVENRSQRSESSARGSVNWSRLRGASEGVEDMFHDEGKAWAKGVDRSCNAGRRANRSENPRTVRRIALADYAAENFEIASYTALISAAQELGDQEIIRVCQQILRDEQEMASWLQQNLPTLVQQTLLQVTRS